ncbi:PREDICTED: cGMP-dependent protein kinase 1-like isoform X2 [Branchiostoma belcheri]|uniref:cGMP-dependent protein kinase 1-like isoform X2 n=1 Tax=Branchiostoma belcheri TaxID=7741 RepID=A0A6P4YDQ4_BRABE|nr:PREDICTED: cGMP-dependent protein kinase 1-like isoform X2 [Branchiostoma belcheri]
MYPGCVGLCVLGVRSAKVSPHTGMAQRYTAEMGSLLEMQKLLKKKDEKIRELQVQLERKDAEIIELKTKLDKYQSVFKPGMAAMSGTAGPAAVRRRAQGISAEPQSMKTLQDVTKQKFKKYIKSKR